QDRPPGALDTGCRGGELRLKPVEGAEMLVECGAELTVGLASAVRRHVLPENRMVDMAAEIEREILLELVDIREIAGRPRTLEALQSRIRAVDVRIVMLIVMQFHDPARNMGLKGTIVVRQVRKGVFSHSSSSTQRV